MARVQTSPAAHFETLFIDWPNLSCNCGVNQNMNHHCSKSSLLTTRMHPLNNVFDYVLLRLHMSHCVRVSSFRLSQALQQKIYLAYLASCEGEPVAEIFKMPFSLYFLTGVVARSRDLRRTNASRAEWPHISSDGCNLTHTSGRSGLPKSLQRLSLVK